MARTVRRRRYEVTEMYALIEISNQMLRAVELDCEEARISASALPLHEVRSQTSNVRFS